MTRRADPMPQCRTSPVACILTVAVIAAALAAAGCDGAAPPPRTATQVSGTSRHTDRRSAIASAQRDAALRFGELAVAGVDAQRMGGVWVVELRGANGGGLRYAISTQDGSIRERSAFR